MSNSASTLGAAYKRIYNRICCANGSPLPWHFQWLSAYYLWDQLAARLPELRGVALDVGCGDKPYASLLRNVDAHIGIDVYAGPAVDHVIAPGEQWPLADASCDVVLATQVLEHVRDLNHTIEEMRRVVKPGGTVVISIPFIFNEHGMPDDYRRFTQVGAIRLFADWQVTYQELGGGIGSTLVTLLLNWIDTALNASKVTRILKAIVLPLWIPFSLLLNGLALGLNRLDRTRAFYGDVLVIFRASD